MASILNPTDLSNIKTRIKSIDGNEKALWGRMTVNEMVCHLTDQIRVGTGDILSKDISSFALRNIVKNLVLMGMPTPKGKVMTVPEMNQEKKGTPPTTLENDKQLLLDSIDKLAGMEDTKPHPAFGKMNRKQWAKLSYLHMDHHLKQFGK